MKIWGIVFNRNILAVMIGMGIILLCLIISYLFQKKLFDRYRGKSAPSGSHAKHKTDRKDRW